MKKREGKWIDRALLYGPYTGICVSENEFQRQLKKLKVPKTSWPEWIPEDADAATHILESTEKSLLAIVCMEPKPETDPNLVVGMLIHEAVHVWQHFKESIGEHSPSKEFEAYSIQTISQRLIAAYSELTAKRKKKKVNNK